MVFSRFRFIVRHSQQQRLDPLGIFDCECDGDRNGESSGNDFRLHLGRRTVLLLAQNLERRRFCRHRGTDHPHPDGVRCAGASATAVGLSSTECDYLQCQRDPFMDDSFLWRQLHHRGNEVDLDSHRWRGGRFGPPKQCDERHSGVHIGNSHVEHPRDQRECLDFKRLS